MTHCFDMFRLPHLWDLQEGDDGVFETAEKKLCPRYGSCYRRLELILRRFVLHSLKGFICVFHLQKNGTSPYLVNT